MKTILLAFLIALVSCAPESEKARTSVRISLPSASTQNGLRHYQPKGQFGLNDLASLDDIDCYAILYESSGFSPGQCTDTAGNPVANALEVYGSFAAGSTVDVEVPSGPGATIHLIGFAYNGGTNCPDYRTFPLTDQTNASKGKLLDSVTTDIQGDEITINMTRNFSGPTIQGCYNPPFDWEGNDPGVWNETNWNEAQWQ